MGCTLLVCNIFYIEDLCSISSNVRSLFTFVELGSVINIQLCGIIFTFWNYDNCSGLQLQLCDDG